MDKNQKRDLVEHILKTCLFSEYLPSEFTTKLLNNKCLDICNKNIFLEPLSFSMDKFNELKDRRYIFVPEITSFISAVRILSDGNILNEMIMFNKKNNHSLSKIINEKKEVKKFVDVYNIFISKSVEVFTESKDNDFLKNLEIKLEKSKACKYVLHLDISNCYNSIYAHNITAILKGVKWASEQYSKYKREENVDPEYKKLSALDRKIREMNCQKSNGLLTGPKLSFIIAESLLTRIDAELEAELNDLGVDFVRYVDDYDVFIQNENKKEQIKDIFISVLHRYDLTINDSKTRIEEFPFYTYIDYKSIVDEKNNIDDSNLINQYAKFSQIEKLKIQNGAILYFCENVLSRYINSDIALSLNFSILRNVPKALRNSCKNLIKFSLNKKDEIKELLSCILRYFANIKYDLECIWIIYIIYKLYPDYSIDIEVLNQLNEIALVILIYESQEVINNNIIKNKAKNGGWLLNYELFYENIISEDELKENLKVSNIESYKELKAKQIHFYIKDN